MSKVRMLVQPWVVLGVLAFVTFSYGMSRLVLRGGESEKRELGPS